MSIYHSIVNSKSKQIAVLLDPDKHTAGSVKNVITSATKNDVDFFFVGGSHTHTDIAGLIRIVKQNSDIPVIIFPGNWIHLSELADGILFLSLISGRNPEYLIGQHVIAAPYLRKSQIEIIPTGYILVENGKITSVEYVSNTKPIPADKPELAAATAMAGEMLGLKLIYLEAGSGALKSVDPMIISEVRKNVSVPVIVGGGIRTPEQAGKIYDSGADIIVVGSIVEEDSGILKEICGIRRK